MEHEDPDREQRDSSFDRDPDAERKVEERFAEMAARAGSVRGACRNRICFHGICHLPSMFCSVVFRTPAHVRVARRCS
jgi:hypothetical protein